MIANSSDSLKPSGFEPEFAIGITGHRDLASDETDRIRESISDEIKKIATLLPHVPVRIISGLAEGADTIAVEAALTLGIRVSAILPMPLAAYRGDFSGPALEKFDALVADSRIDVSEIPMGEAENRNDQYSLLGDYLVRRSNLLLAVWNGEQTGLQGGTSDVLMRFLGDGRQNTLNFIKVDSNQADGCGNVLTWIPAKRISSDVTAQSDKPSHLISNANYDCFWSDTEIPASVMTRWKGFDEFCVERSSSLAADLPGYGLGNAISKDCSNEISGLDAEFVRSDQIARHFQLKSHRMFALFGLLAAGMGLAFLVYAKLLADKNLLLIYVGLFVVGFIGFRYTHRQHLHSKHLAYRVLAETLRVQYFLILSGAGGKYNLRRILSLTSVDQFARFEWLQEALRVCEPVVYSSQNRSDSILEALKQGWISDQLKYFEKKRAAMHRQHRRLEAIKFALLVGSVVGALTLVFFKKDLLYLDVIGYDGKAWLVFFMGLLPLWAAVWELYQGKMATRELLWQYANQAKYFRRAEYEIDQVSEITDIQRLVRDLADKALIEIYMWSVHRFHREHEPPAAG